MKISFDIWDAGLEYNRFASKEEWDSFARAFRPNRGFYMSEPQLMYPIKFPCQMLSDPGNVTINDGGNDTYWNKFFYDNELCTEED